MTGTARAAAEPDLRLHAWQGEAVGYLMRHFRVDPAEADDLYAAARDKVRGALASGGEIHADRLRGYFYRTLQNEALMARRRSRPTPLPPDALERAAGELLSPEGSTEAEALRCVEGLEEPLRELVRRHYWEQVPLGLIARERGVSAPTVSRMHTEALARIFRCLKRADAAILPFPRPRVMGALDPQERSTDV